MVKAYTGGVFQSVEQLYFVRSFREFRMAQCAAPKTSGIIRKSSRLRDREVPPRKRRRGARLRGNGDRGTCLTEGEALLRRSAGYIFIPFQEIPRQARNDNKKR